MCVEYHRRLSFALTSSLEDPSIRHRTVTHNLLTKKITGLKDMCAEFLTHREGTNIRIIRHLDYCMRARQLLSIHDSKLCLIKQGTHLFLDELTPIAAVLSQRKPPPHTLNTLITSIMQPLLNLGINGLHDLLDTSGMHIMSVQDLQANKFSRVNKKVKVAANRLAAIVNLHQDVNFTSNTILTILALKSTKADTLAINRKINNTLISGLIDSHLLGAPDQDADNLVVQNNGTPSQLGSNSPATLTHSVPVPQPCSTTRARHAITGNCSRGPTASPPTPSQADPFAIQTNNSH